MISVFTGDDRTLIQHQIKHILTEAGLAEPNNIDDCQQACLRCLSRGIDKQVSATLLFVSARELEIDPNMVPRLARSKNLLFFIQQQLVQARIEEKENQYQSPRTKREKNITRHWVEIQQQLLKKSQWRVVIKNAHSLTRKKQDLIKAITSFERYLTNNQSRIDYQSYLGAGLMIGSGVVESSNRRVVRQRLK